MATTMTEVAHPKVVSQDQWLAARKEFLLKEKELTRLRDELSRQRRELPWERVEKQYEFEGPEGKASFSDLFDGRSQLLVYHFMYTPGWSEGCRGCSFLADHFDGTTIHLANRDVTLVVVSRAPIEEIEAFKKRMGWKFRWVSSFASDFNYDYHVSFRQQDRVNGKVDYNYELIDFPMEDAPGFSVFAKDADGEIFHTYSTYGRGGDIHLGTYNFLDLVPKGRDEHNLQHSMGWVRHHDKYGEGYFVDASSQYEPPKMKEQPKSAEHSCCSSEHHG